MAKYHRKQMNGYNQIESHNFFSFYILFKRVWVGANNQVSTAATQLPAILYYQEEDIARNFSGFQEPA